jgi:DNA-directed RNA polymerase specialized sigma24 family protein
MKETRRFLEQLEKLDLMIENKMIEREQWKAIAEGVTAGGTSVIVHDKKGRKELHNMEKVQASSNPQKMADAIHKMIEIDAEIDLCIDKLIEAKKDVINVIEQLPAAEYDIIHKIYVQHIPLYEVSTMSDRSYSSITTLHGRALKNVQRILNERRCDDV